MSRFGFLVGSMFLATSSLLGCAAADPSENASSEETVTEAASAVKTAPAQIPLPGWGIKLSRGQCSNNGFILSDGGVYRLGKYIGPDVSGITVHYRTASGEAVCHNIKAWTSLVQYACNVNTAEGNTVDATIGTYTGLVLGTSEWINFVELQYPSEVMSDALYFGYATFPERANVSIFPDGDPCPSSAAADLALLRIECCATLPTP